MKRFQLAAVALVSAMLPLQTIANELDGPSLRKLVTGRTVYLAAPLGGEFPLNYKSDGTVNGDGSAVGLGRFFAARETGNWRIAGNMLCQKFPTWYKGEQLCFTVRELGNRRIKWVRDNGEEGIARVSD